MKTRLTYLSLITAVLLVSFMGVSNAEAKNRVRVKVRTPQISVRVKTMPVVHRRTVIRRVPLPVRFHAHYDITKKDRKIARRLAKYTGTSKRELVELRRQGYRWSEIGRWLDLPRHTVRAARDADTWKQFLRREDRQARRGHHNHRRSDNPSVCYHN